MEIYADLQVTVNNEAYQLHASGRDVYLDLPLKVAIPALFQMFKHMPGSLAVVRQVRLMEEKPDITLFLGRRKLALFGRKSGRLAHWLLAALCWIASIRTAPRR